MKKIALSVWAVAALSSFGFAGGDIAPVEPVVETPMVEVENNFYVGLGISAVSTGHGDMDFFKNHLDRDRTGNLLVLAGYEFNPYVAVEGRYSTYMFDEHSTNTDTWGIYAKPQYPVTEDLKVYALVGFGGITVDGVKGHDIDMDDTGFQWGFGASYGVTENTAVFVDFNTIVHGMSGTWNGTARDDVDADAISIGITYNF